jgi:uncharacterized membrane protein YkoI
VASGPAVESGDTTVDHEENDMRTRTTVIVGAVVAAAVATGGGVAIAGNGDDGPASHQYTQEQADAAPAAALEATGGGTVNSVETDNEDGATYEVEVTKPNGTTVDVRLDESYQVVVIEGDSEDESGDDESD